jgi:hypothetical protein
MGPGVWLNVKLGVQEMSRGVNMGSNDYFDRMSDKLIKKKRKK